MLNRLNFQIIFLIFLFALVASCNNNIVATKHQPDDENAVDGFWDTFDNISKEGILFVPEKYVDFGVVYIHSNPKLFSTRTIHVNNVGGGVLDYQTATLINDFIFDAEKTTCGLTGGRLAPLSSCVYVINFMPVSVSEPSGSLRITSKNEGSLVKIHGKGDLILRGNVNADYDQIYFPVTLIDTQSSVTITVKNTGSEQIRFKTTQPKSPYSITGGSCALQNQTLASNATCTITITFSPKTVGTTADKMMLTSNDGNSNPFYISLNGSAIRDGFLSVASNEINFGLVKVGESKTKVFNITNIGTLSISFKTIIPDGFTDGGSTCNLKTFQNLLAGESCLVSLKFAPTRAVQYTDIIRFATNKSSNIDIKLIASGMDKEPIQITPSAVNFGTVLVGTNSDVRSVLVTNTARLPIQFDITMPENFLYQNSSSCSLKNKVLNPDESCLINIVFAPKEWKPYADIITLTHELNTYGDVSFNVEGNGTVVGEITTAPATIDFGLVEVNTIAPIKVLTLSNSGGLPLIVSTTFPAGFTAITGSCTLFNQPLNPGESCTFEIRFNPTALKDYSGNILMTYNGKMKNMPIRGIGSLPSAITVNTTPLVFPDTAVGSTSAPKLATINSVGGLDAIVDITLPTGFETAGGTCTLPISTIPSGSSCTLSIVFKPTASRAYASMLSLLHSATTTNINLSGLGYNAPEISATPLLTIFDNLVIGLTQPPKTITLTNIGDKDATFNTSLPSFVKYDATSTCVLNNQLLAPHNTCLLNVTFSPTAPVDYAGNIQYAVFGGKNTTSQVQGKGLSDVFVTATPATLSFGNVVVNTTSKKEILVQNTGGADTSLNVALSANFTHDASSTCSAIGHILRAGDSCKVVVTFDPTAIQTYAGSLTLSYFTISPIANKTLTVGLAGNGVAQGELSLSNATLTFPQTTVGLESAIQKVTAFNIGGGPIDISVAVPANFVLKPLLSTCTLPTTTLDIGNSCEYAFAFKPIAVGNITETATFTYGTEVKTLNLSGKSISGSIANFNPPTLDFGNKILNIKSLKASVTLSNIGDQILRYSITAPTSDFTYELSSTCSLVGTVAPSATCRIDLTFTPTTMKDYTANLILLDTVKNTVTTLVITGKGVSPRLIVTPSTVVFEDTKVNQTSSTAQVVVRNAGTTPISFSRGSVVGFQAVLPPTGGSIPACGFSSDTLNIGGSCIYNFQFKPLATQQYKGNMVFLADDDNYYELALSGRGVAGTSPISISTSEMLFYETAVDYNKAKTATIENITDNVVSFSIDTPIDFDIDNSSTCKENNRLEAHQKCELVIGFEPEDEYEYDTEIKIYDKEFEDKISLKAKSVKKGTVVYLYDNITTDSLKFTADDDNVFIYNIIKNELLKFSKKTKMYESLMIFETKLIDPHMSLDNGTTLMIADNKTKTLLKYKIEDGSYKYEEFGALISTHGKTKNGIYMSIVPDIEEYESVVDEFDNIYLINKISKEHDKKYIKYYSIDNNKNITINIDDTKKTLSFKSSEYHYSDGNIYAIDNTTGKLFMILP